MADPQANHNHRDGRPGSHAHTPCATTGACEEPDTAGAGTSISMVRAHLLRIPDYPLPAGFRIRRYTPGDETAWLDIHLAADRYNRFDERTFRRQFGTRRDILASRQLYLIDPDQRPVGTVTAWFQEDWGRIHWVAIHPDRQGEGLSKPMLAAACRRLKTLGHRRAYLTTSTGRLPAIRLYHGFGFR